MKRSSLFALFMVAAMGVFCASSAVAQVGIFDKAADWSGRGSTKIDGAATIDGTGTSAFYTLEGNGDDIWDQQDEGYYIYTEKAGSWSLSGKVGWIEPGSNQWSKMGVMIREKGDKVDSRYYFAELRGNGFGDRTDAQWRPDEGGNAIGTQIFEDVASFTSLEADADGYLWLRVTRLAATNRFVAEWSRDGSTWNPGHSVTLEGWQDTVAYGLAITSHTDNDEIAMGEVTDVQLTKIPFEAQRTISAEDFSPGRPVTGIKVNVFVAQGETPNLTITENAPAGWSVSNVQVSAGDAQVSGNVITWTINAASGNPTLTYDATSPADASSGEWSGSATGAGFDFPLGLTLLASKNKTFVYFVGGSQADADLPRNTVYMDLLSDGLTILDENNQEVFIPGLGYEVQFINHDIDDPAIAATFDVVIVEESVNSNAAARYIDLPVPYLAMEQVLYAGRDDREGSLWFGPQSGVSLPSGEFEILISDNTHPITNIYQQDEFLPITLNVAGEIGGMALDVLAPVAKPLAVSIDESRAVLAVAEAGESGLAGNEGLTPPAGSEPLPARRAMLGYHQFIQVFDNGAEGIENIAITKEGAILFQRVVQWLLGVTPTADGTEAGVPVHDWSVY